MFDIVDIETKKRVVGKKEIFSFNGVTCIMTKFDIDDPLGSEAYGCRVFKGDPYEGPYTCNSTLLYYDASGPLFETIQFAPEFGIPPSTWVGLLDLDKVDLAALRIFEAQPEGEA